MGEPTDTRLRILEATYARIAADGLARTTVEAVAQSGGVARATIYRYFPGGRDELIQATTTWEVGRFFSQLADDTAESSDFPDWLGRTLAAARRRLEEHEVLQQVLLLESEHLLPQLLTVMPIVLDMLCAEIEERLAGERLRPGVAPHEAADLLSRLMLSFIGTPGVWHLDDPAEVDRLVRTQLLAGVLA